MSKVSAFLGRKGGSGSEKGPVSLASKPEAPDETDPDRFLEAGTRLGEENEALRSLLGDAERRIGELDALKEAFSRISEPIAKTMRSLEQEKLHNAALQTLLADIRAAHEKLRGDFHLSERRTASLENVNERLREDLERAQQQARAIDAARLELVDELAAKRDQIATLERQLAHESAERARLADDKQTLSQQLADAEKKIIQLEADVSATREKAVLIEDELRTLQKSLDETIGESTRLGRRVIESENELAAARGQIGKLGSAVAEAEAERNRLATALDEANSRHQSETYSLNVRLGSLQSRALSAEKLLAEARQTLIARTEEARGLDRKNVETAIALSAAEKKVRQLEATVEAHERTIRDNEQSRAAMTERANGLTRTLREREVALARAEEQIQSLTGRIAKLETDAQVSQIAYDKRIEELNAALHRERMERSVVEGALESSRRDAVRAQREQAGYRGAAVAVMDKPRTEAAEDESTAVQTIPGPSVQPDRSA